MLVPYLDEAGDICRGYLTTIGAYCNSTQLFFVLVGFA